jgi:glycosyltransferase involved in cell wall biosynthesis
LKVLHVYRTYFPDSQGGLEEVVRQICFNARAQGVESRVFTLSDKPEPAVINSVEAQIVRVKKTFEIASSGFSLAGFAEFRRQAAWADIVHFHFPWPFADLLNQVLPKGKPTLVTYHSDIVRQRILKWVYWPLMRDFLSSVDQIVATSPNYRASSKTLANYDHKLTTIPIGITESSYLQRGDYTLQLAEVEASFGQGFFLFIGVLRYYKGLSILLKAIKNAPYKVVIAGTGPAEQELLALAKTLALDNVVFTGFVSDEMKMALLQSCRGVVLPSHLRSEAFGVTLLEGAMCGKPLISAEVGSGTSYINIDGETGRVVKPNNVEALRQAMDELYNNSKWAVELGTAARARYEALFTGEKMGKAYSALYATLCDVDISKLKPLQCNGKPVSVCE